MNHYRNLSCQVIQNKGKFMSKLEWREGNFPVSLQFDDPYYSVVDGRAETDHVFINGNMLPERWPNMRNCTLAELGFGTGLNFLETVRQWQETDKTDSKLQFISFEQYPMSATEMTKALSRWPVLSHLSQTLIEGWKPEAQTIEIKFGDTISLSVHIGDANSLLPQLNFQADAWYLDGFSPAKNPELWNEALMEEVAEHTANDGTFATYTAAGFVKRGLQAAGFQVEKTKGFGRKRDMLIGKMLK
jgi:tRNA U34 5-methylaminomethyl-2-thiouridine-forming methyltransferase MnmC